MNGATAEPCARTSNDPTSASETMIGSSQNFLRSLKKNQNSFKNSISENLRVHSSSIRRQFIRDSKLMPHVRNLSRFAHDSIRFSIRVEFAVHRIFSRHAHNDPHRRHNEVEEQAENDFGIDPSQDVSQEHPYP